MTGLVPHAFAQNATAPAADTVRPEVAKPLQAAQDLVRAQKYKEALAQVREADAIADKTPFEAFMIDNTRGVAAVGAGDTATAARSFEATIASGRMTPAEQGKIVLTLAGMYYQAADYPKAIVWLQRAVKEGSANGETRSLLVQSYYFGGDLQQASTELKADLAAADKAGRTPTETQLKMLMSIGIKQGDKAATAAAMERLVTTYPAKQYWADLMQRLRSKPGFPDHLVLDFDRLKLALGQLSTTGDVTEMAQLAMQAGFPAEARKVVDLGYQQGLLGSGPDAQRHKRLQDQATKAAADDLKTMASSEAEARKGKEGTGLANLGYALVTAGQTERGIAMIEEGIARGGLKRADDARLHLGIAYLQAGKKTEALKVLATVQGTDGAADLARYWSILANHPLG
ncbi:MAG: tetratricopeptide repeat protein [Herminiimonas sp.]|nr:tetratricopeptide repeat protein [Herminiimonas sp.]